MLATIGGPNAAFAQSCTGQCVLQAADQEVLLSPFNALKSSLAGQAVLDKNLQVENDIYRYSTQDQKISSGTILIVPLIPANVLIRAFPGNSNFYYNAQGLPTAPALPSSVTAMVGDISNNIQIDAMKPYFGGPPGHDTYGSYYGYVSGQSDSVGNPPPYQVSQWIFDHPFTPANSSYLAWQIQQTQGAYGANWQLGDSKIGDFPSAHTMASTINAIPYAILAPGYYQQLAMSVAKFAYDLNVNGVHYPLDVIGGRILGTYVMAQMLAGNQLYASTTFNAANLESLSHDMQAYLGGGGSSPYAAPCANLVACVNHGVIPTAATYTQAGLNYVQFLTYGLPSVGDTTLAPVVPSEAPWLIATRFPYLSVAQLNDVLATTELPSGGPLDNGTGWARLNLYAAAGGYGAFPNNVTVNMNAARGGLNAFDIWSNNISGPGGLTLQGSGTLILAGDNSYTGGTNVQGGTLAVTGSLLGPLSVSPGASFILGNTGTFTGDVNNSGTFNNNGVVSGVFTNSGLLSGNGSVGSLALLPGSTIAPGNSVGTIQVVGNLTVATGTTYRAQVEGNGADQIQVGGTATLSGGTVIASLIGYNPVLGHPYPIVTAAGGVAGTFATVTADNLPFIQPSLSYDPNDVFLTLTRNGVAYASVATSANQVAVANAIDAGGAGSGLNQALASQSVAGAQHAFDALSGEIHAGAQTVMLNDSLYVREALLGRMRQASFADGLGPVAALASGGPTLAYAEASGSSLPPSVASALAYADDQRPAFPIKAALAAVPATTFWTQAVGAWGRFDGDGNAAAASSTLAGFFSGVDRRFGPNWLAGLAGGYTTSSVSTSDRTNSASIETAHLAGYVAANYGSWNLRAAAATSFSTLGTNRSIAFPGFFETTTAHYGATTTQIFGEVSYGVTFGQIAAEPFGGLGFVHLRTDSFAETAASGVGIAALSGSGRSDIGYSTLGGRAATNYVLPNGMVLTPRASAAWQHAFGSVTPTETLAFQSTGAPFTIAGLPLARDTALVESGVDLHVNQQTRLGLIYSSQLGNHVQHNSVQGNVTMRF